MKLLCKIHREGGTVVSLDNKTYQFKPDEDGQHVCEVANERHAERLLAIPEAYGMYRKPGEVEGEDDLLTDDSSDAGNGNEEPEGDPDEFDMTQNVDDLDNDELAKYAKWRGMNPKSKKSIADYALDNFDEHVDDQQNCAAMIREVYALDQEEALEEGVITPDGDEAGDNE